MKRQPTDRLFGGLHQDCFRQLGIHAVSAVFDGNHTAAPAAGDHRDRLSAVATQGKQECIQFLVIGFDGPNDVFLAYLRGCQIHTLHPILIFRCR